MSEPRGRQPLVFTVDMRVRPADVEAFRSELLTAVDLVQQEDACQLIAAHQAVDDPGSFLMYERWADGPTFWDEVRCRPYFRHYKEATEPHHLVRPHLRAWSVLNRQSTEEER